MNETKMLTTDPFLKNDLVPLMQTALSLWIYLRAFFLPLPTMNYKLIITILLFATFSCSNPQNFKKAEDAQDAAREFIRASLDGNYDKAKFYLYPDANNKFLLERWEKTYGRLRSEEKQQYKDADIIVLDTHPINDSVFSYKYLNSYKKDTSTVKVLRINGEWLVDLKELIR